MKKIILALSLLTTSFAQAQNTTLHTNGSQLLGICNDEIILRGINYAPYNWGYDLNSEKLGQIAQTGANAVRLVWYASSNAPYYSNVDNLDTILTRCIRHKMIPIIELHDNTCSDNLAALEATSNWFTGTAVKTVLNRHKHSLIVNIANEAGYANWTGNTTTALANFRSTYQTIVSNLRTNGLDMPLMIDAPDCGQSMTQLGTVASALVTADPNHNLIFSAHAYWFGYANNDSLSMRNIITSAQAQNVPWVLGEVANLQDDATACQYSLNSRALLNICQQLNMPWLWWAWDNDSCPNRQVSTNGNYNSLTAAGQQIVNNASYGLRNTAVRTTYLVNNQEGCALSGTGSINDQASCRAIFVGNQLTIETLINESALYTLYDLNGRLLWSNRLAPRSTETFSLELPQGVYVLAATTSTQSNSIKVMHAY